jgi:hypothetical protein
VASARLTIADFYLSSMAEVAFTNSLRPLEQSNCVGGCHAEKSAA